MNLTRSVLLTLATAVGHLLFSGNAFAGSYFVAPNGSDSAGGDAAAPFRTIQKGIDAATKPGDSLTIAAGVYHEELVLGCQGTAEAPIVIKAAENQSVIVDGAERATGWIPQDAGHNVWSLTTGPQAPYKNDNGRWDLPPRSEQVFVDGKRCTHIKEDAPTATMADGSFTATLTDPAKYTLKLAKGVDPNAALTEITRLKKLLDVKEATKHLVLDGIYFRRAVNTYQENLVELRGDVIEVKNCIFEYSSAGRGLDVGCDHSRLHDNIIRNNGCLGFAFHGVDDLFDDNLVSGNDLASYGEWEAGGVKIVGNGHIIRHNRFIDNLGGVAIWLDVYPCNCVIEDNYVSGNRGEGIRAETSFHNYIGYNIVENTRACPYTDHGKTNVSPGIGISVQNSAETVVCNNFLKDNSGTDIQLFNYNRPTKTLPKFVFDYPDEKHRQWLKRSEDRGMVFGNDNLIVNNIIVQTTSDSSHAGIWFRGGLDGEMPTSYGNKIDYNFYWDTITHAPKVQLEKTLEVPDGTSKWQSHGFDTHVLGGFTAADYAKSPFARSFPYAPNSHFSGIGKGTLVPPFPRHEEVDFAGNPSTSGGACSMGPFQSVGK